MYGNNVPATICEQVAPTAPPPMQGTEPPPMQGAEPSPQICELANVCDGILSDCLSVAGSCLQLILGEDSLPVETMSEPMCLRDSLSRCRAQADTLRQLLMRLRKGLG